MATRAAILIGIENIAGMTPLPGAVTGALDMAAWATNQGWDSVRVFSDAGGQPVSYQTVFQHIDSLLRPRSLQQLLLYFAGHGQCWAVDADFWILTGTRVPGDVVNVANTVTLARQSGVPNITIIADACRSIGTANDAAISQIAVPLFPGEINPASRSKVDQFYATQPTQAALEIRRRVDQEGAIAEDATKEIELAARQSYGVFTKCLLAALNGLEDAAKSRMNDDRIVIQPRRLADFLEWKVHRESGILGGFAQRPDCRPESDQVLSTVQAAAQFQLQVEVRLQDESPAEGSSLELLRYDPTDPNFFVTQRRIRSWSLSEFLPRGNTYGIRATMPEYHQSPKSPNPLIILMENSQVVVRMEPSAVAEVRTRGDLELIVDIGLTMKSIEIDKAFVVSEDGGRLSEAPADGVFPVVEIDGLTGHESRSMRFLRKGDRPDYLRPSDPESMRLIQQATELKFRESYGTQTGLTILGINEVGVFDTYDTTYAFHENGQLHVRGAQNTSSSLVLDLGQDRYAALARFDGFVGNVRVSALGVENLTYLPALGGRFEDGLIGVLRQHAQAALAIAEAAAGHGQFDLAIDESLPIAEILRMYNHYNPVLGIFAAYAYHQARAIDQIRDIIEYFVEHKQTVPFDVYLLSGLKREEIHGEIAPGYPMLTQGWCYLGGELHPAIAAARQSLAPTLWSTIVGDAGRKLAEAVKKGEVR
jgi:hypothetical protein